MAYSYLDDYVLQRELGDFASGYSGGVSSGPYSGYDEYDVDYHVPVRRTTVTRTVGLLVIFKLYIMLF